MDPHSPLTRKIETPRMYDNRHLLNEFCTYVCNIDCDSSVLLLGRVVDLAVILELGQILAGQHLCNGGR